MGWGARTGREDQEYTQYRERGARRKAEDVSEMMRVPSLHRASGGFQSNLQLPGRPLRSVSKVKTSEPSYDREVHQ